jgi:hypothetical protein
MIWREAVGAKEHIGRKIIKGILSEELCYVLS